MKWKMRSCSSFLSLWKNWKTVTGFVLRFHPFCCFWDTALLKHLVVAALFFSPLVVFKRINIFLWIKENFLLSKKNKIVFFKKENEILEAGWDRSKNGQEKHIHPTPFLMKRLLCVCSKIREGHSSLGGDGTNVSPAVLDFGKRLKGISVKLQVVLPE